MLRCFNAALIKPLSLAKTKMVTTKTGGQRKDSGPAPATATIRSEAATTASSVSVDALDDITDRSRRRQNANAKAPIEKPKRLRSKAPSKQTSKYLSLTTRSTGGATTIGAART